MSSNVVKLSDKAKSQLDYLSKATSIPRNRLLGILIQEIFNIGVNFERLTLDFEGLVSQNKIYIYANGRPKMKLLTRTEVEKQ